MFALCQYFIKSTVTQAQGSFPRFLQTVIKIFEFHHGDEIRVRVEENKSAKMYFCAASCLKRFSCQIKRTIFLMFPQCPILSFVQVLWVQFSEHGLHGGFICRVINLVWDLTKVPRVRRILSLGTWWSTSPTMAQVRSPRAMSRKSSNPYKYFDFMSKHYHWVFISLSFTVTV